MIDRSPRIPLAAATLVALLVGVLACSGFSEPCDSKTFVPSCTGETTFQICAAGWGYKPVVHNRSCGMNEICLLDENSEPVCGIGPPLATCETADDRRCVDGQLQHCHGEFVKSADGEMFWTHDDDCGRTGATCVQHGYAASCVRDTSEECDVEHLSQCVGNTPRTCYLLSGNPPEGDPKGFWSTLKPCASDEVCMATDARAVCVAAPVETCFVSDEPRCVDGRLQECVRPRDHPTHGAAPDPHWTWTDEDCSAEETKPGE